MKDVSRVRLGLATVGLAGMGYGLWLILRFQPISKPYKLIEWLATLPTHLKIRGQEGKFLLKKAMEPQLPADVLYRPKMGFSVPLARWFRGPLKQRVRDAVLGERLASTGWFNRDYLRHLVDAHQSGTSDYSAPLWAVLMFEAFLRNVVDVHPAAAQPQPEAEALA